MSPLYRIALQEIDHHFLPDARDVDAAEAGPRPDLRDSHPTAAVVVFLVGSVPVKADFDASVFVGQNLLLGVAGDDGGLWPLHHGLLGDA